MTVVSVISGPSNRRSFGGGKLDEVLEGVALRFRTLAPRCILLGPVFVWTWMVIGRVSGRGCKYSLPGMIGLS